MSLWRGIAEYTVHLYTEAPTYNPPPNPMVIIRPIYSEIKKIYPFISFPLASLFSKYYTVNYSHRTLYYFKHNIRKDCRTITLNITIHITFLSLFILKCYQMKLEEISMFQNLKALLMYMIYGHTVCMVCTMHSCGSF